MSYHVQVYQEEQAITLEFGIYRATVLPGLGGNLISFRDVERDFHFIREPQSVNCVKSDLTAYGIPILFPPNRYEDGCFTIHGQRYEFPLNEKSTHNHLHGFLYNRPWKVKDVRSSDSGAHVILTHQVDKNHEVYNYFPHEFTFSIQYSLTIDGLFQVASIRNNGNNVMPCMLGFHTTFNAPFSKKSSIKDYRFVVTIGKRWELSKRMLPTGKFQSLTKQELLMKTKGISPFFKPLDNHYTATPQRGKNYMMLMDFNEKIRLIYDVGLKYKHWMIWNADAKNGFFCPEPQTNVVNAPNLNVPLDDAGVYLLEPGESWNETSRIHIENLE